METPGHTPHHCSLLLRNDESTLFFAADICYSQYQLLEEKYSGTNASQEMSKDTYDRVKRFAKKQKVVFIPSHDADGAVRLKEGKSLFDT